MNETETEIVFMCENRRSTFICVCAWAKECAKNILFLILPSICLSLLIETVFLDIKKTQFKCDEQHTRASTEPTRRFDILVDK